MKKYLAIILSFLAILSLYGCNGKSSPENQVIKYNLENEPKSLDPQISNDYSANIVIMNIFEGLTKLDEKGNASYGAAAFWDNNEDFTEFTFYLRKGLSWSDKDKTPLTANDFLFGIQRALEKKTAAPLASTLYCIKNAKKINLENANPNTLGAYCEDEYTIKFYLEYPNKDFPKILSTPVTMPCNKDFFENCFGQYGLESKTVLSNGPFKIKAKYGWNHFKSLSLVRNSNYIGEKLVTPAGVDFSIEKNLSDAVDLIKSGELDAGPLPLGSFADAKSQNFKLTSFNDTVWGLCFNLKEQPTSSLNIRKSLIFSLNYNDILSNLPENCTVADSIVIDGLTVGGVSFKSTDNISAFTQSINNSKTFLNAGLKELKLKECPPITILCLDNPEVKGIVNNIIETLNKKLNYNFNMNPVSQAELKNKVNSANYQVALAPISAQSSSTLDFLSMFKSNNEKNICHMQSAEYDKMIEKAAISAPNEAINLLNNAQNYIYKNAIFYPMYFETRYFAASQKVSGIIFHKYKTGIDFSHAIKLK